VKKGLVLLALLVCVWGGKLMGQNGFSEFSVDSLYDVVINGTGQKILVQGNNVNNPVLLWIHGEPEMQAGLIAPFYIQELEKHYIIVNWYPKVTGLLLHAAPGTESIPAGQLTQNALELTRFLLDKYKKQKVYLLGQSFGSVIGIGLAEKYPQYYNAYIGVGQIIMPEKSNEVLSRCLINALPVGLDALVNETPNKKNLLNIKLVRDCEKWKVAGKDFNLPVGYESLVKKMYIPNGQTDLIRSISGVSDFTANPEFEIPVSFFMGSYDHVSACEKGIIEAYYKKIKSPKKKLINFKESAHYPNLEEPLKFQHEIIDINRGYLAGFLLPGNNGRVISPFGPRHMRMHYGTDLKMARGDTVVSVQSGTVIRAGWGTGFGKLIIVKHENNIQTYYAHLSKFLKKKGQQVEKGEPIGLAGSTGRATGPHLHFEIHENGRVFDSELVFDYKNRKIRDEALDEGTLVAIHRKLRPRGYANNRAVPEYYKVRRGDSLWKIARRFKTSMKMICRLNHITENSVLQIGQPLKMY